MAANLERAYSTTRHRSRCFRTYLVPTAAMLPSAKKRVDVARCEVLTPVRASLPLGRRRFKRGDVGQE